jgi:hypothetical protein
MPVATNYDASAWIRYKDVSANSIGNSVIDSTKKRSVIPYVLYKPVYNQIFSKNRFIEAEVPFRRTPLSTRTLVAGSEGIMTATIDGNSSTSRIQSASFVKAIGNFIYVLDRSYAFLRRLDITTNVLSTYVAAATAVSPNSYTATIVNSSIYYPNSIAYDSTNQTMYLTQSSDILKVNLTTNTVSLLTITPAFSVGSAGVYNRGYVYVVDSQDNVIYKVNVADNTSTIVVGAKGVSGSTDGIGTAARINIGTILTSCLTSDSSNNLYLADRLNKKIRKINLDTLEVSTFLTLSQNVDIVLYEETENVLYYSQGKSFYKVKLNDSNSSVSIATNTDNVSTGTFVNPDLMYLGTSSGTIYKFS